MPYGGRKAVYIVKTSELCLQRFFKTMCPLYGKRQALCGLPFSHILFRLCICIRSVCKHFAGKIAIAGIGKERHNELAFVFQTGSQF